MDYPHFYSTFINKDAVLKLFHRVEIPKGRILLTPGEIGNKLYFIDKGLLRTFYYHNGEEITSSLCAENDFLCVPSSFFFQKPSIEYIETLEKSLLFEIDYPTLQRYQQIDHEIGYFYKYTIENFSLYQEEKFKLFRHSTPYQRYCLFLEHYPSLVHRTPVKYLASFLDIACSTASRIRTKLAKG